MKILFLNEHLSTGGSVQYTYILAKKLIEHGEDVHVVEYNDITGGVFVVQKNLIKNLIGHKLHTLTSANKKQELLTLIKKINPKVVHLQEFPEYWMPEDLTREIYKDNRTYKIIETSHDSNPEARNWKRFLPDGFSFISEFHPSMYKDLNVPYRIVEYPIENYDRPDREKALIDLGLDPNKKHVLNIGLWTSRKNQGEVVEVARSLQNENIQFHFVGNQAENFDYYWKPIMENIPSNCKVWGERKDPDSFYSSMDLMYFASKGTENDRETNPLVIREALSWKLPMIMRNLSVYMGKYDKYPEVTYIDDDIEKTKHTLLSKLGFLGKSITRKEALEISNKVLQTAEKERYDFTIPEEFDFDMHSVFSDDDNKIHLSFYSSENFKGRASIRDVDTKLPIYSFYIDVAEGFTNFWAIPVPSYILKFKNLEKFRGFLIEVYDNDMNKRGENIILVNPDQEKSFDEIPVSSFDSLYINFREFFVNKIYDGLIKPNDIVVDVGANSGIFTLYALSQSASFVYSIEPTKVAYDNLVNVTKGKNVKCIKEALLDKVTEMEINVAINNSTVSSFLDEAHDNSYQYQKEKVKVSTFNNFLWENKISKIDVLKIDIEGSEYVLLDTIQNFDMIGKIILEFHYNKEDKLFNLCKKLSKHYKHIQLYKQSTKYPWTGADNGILVASNDIPINYIASQISVDYPKFTYTYSDSFYAKIRFEELATGTTIYSYDLLFASGVIYWSSLPARIEDVSGVVMIVNDVPIYQVVGKYDKKDNITKDNFYTNPNDKAWFTYYEIFGKEFYTHEKCHVEKGDVVLDIGANYGFFTKYALEKGASKVYAVEPNVKTLGYLKKNTQNDPVTIVKGAVTDVSGKVELNLYELSTVSIVKKVDTGQLGEVYVGTVLTDGWNINDLLMRIMDINFMKIDCEGGEYPLFETIEDRLLCSIPKISGEFHNIGGIKPWTKIIDKLKRLGFETWIEEYTNNTARFFAWREKEKDLVLSDESKKVIKEKVKNFKKKNLKILQVQPGNIPIERKEGEGWWGAIEKIIWEYKKALEKRGHIVYFMSIDDTIKNYKDYDIVHCHMADLSLRLNQEKIPYVNHIHDHHLEVYSKNSRCYHNNKAALDNSIFSLVPGEHMIEYFEHHPKLHFLPHGVDLNYYKPDKTKHNTTSILCVGNNSIGGSDGITSFDRKGFHHAIKAAKILGLPVIIAGPKNWNEQFFKDIPYDYDKVKVIYDPSDAELLEIYQGRNILVHASSVECGHPPLTILEGMACSLPTIATFMGKGIIHPDLEIQRKPIMIADAIQKVLDNYWYYSEWSDRVSSEFSWERVCNELEKLYESSFGLI